MDGDEHLALDEADFALAEHDTERFRRLTPGEPRVPWASEPLECRTRHMVGVLLHS